MEKIAEIESTQGCIQMHAVIPEMVTKHLDHSITSFLLLAAPKKQIVVAIAFDCLYMRSNVSKK